MDTTLVGLLPDIGVVAVALVVVYAIATGRLVTSREHDAVKQDRDEWRRESGVKTEQLAEKDRQLGHMAEVGRTVEAIMTALSRDSRGGGAS